MSKIYFCSDHHFLDPRMDFFVRPYKSMIDNIEGLTKNHNEIVSNDDLVYFLGDIFFNKIKDPKNLDMVKNMNGRKILIMGNHDKMKKEEYLSVFNECHDSLEIEYKEQKLFLVHEPINAKKDIFSIVGHIHGAWRVQRNMINVGVDVWNMCPVDIDKILIYKNLIHNVYDENVFAGELPQNKIT